MVVFGLFGKKKESDVLYDLMDLENNNLNNNDEKEDSMGREGTSMEIIKAAFDKLSEELEFLREEIREKNLLIKILTFRNANDGNEVSLDLINKNTRSTLVETTPATNTNILLNTSNDDMRHYHSTDNISNTDNSPNYVDKKPSKLVNYDETLSDVSEDIEHCNDKVILNSTQVSATKDDGVFTWEKHTNGFPSKMLNKMGYKGTGLGKHENGIRETIIVNESRTLGFENAKGKNDKLLYIASSSMLNRMDEKRLSTEHLRVKVRSHGGCRIKCMYTHLPEMFKEKPDYVLLHIGSNDCTDKTSDEVLRELINLGDYIKKVLPAAAVIFSLPIVRGDNKRASVIQNNLFLKMKRSLLYASLDNSNITLSDLGKKGLHFNASGNRKMAGNIISLTKRL